MGRFIIFSLGLLAMLVVLPLLLAGRWQLGSAKSPQTATVALGTTVIVAGGKAKLWFAQYDEISTMVEVRWAGDKSQFVRLEQNESFETDSGLMLTNLSVSHKHGRPVRAKIKVEWDESE